MMVRGSRGRRPGWKAELDIGIVEKRNRERLGAGPDGLAVRTAWRRP